MAELLKCGIVLDDWKIPIFRKRLTEAGYGYEDGGPIKGKNTLLVVLTPDVAALGKVVEECQAECQRSKGKANG